MQSHSRVNVHNSTGVTHLTVVKMTVWYSLLEFENTQGNVKMHYFRAGREGLAIQALIPYTMPEGAERGEGRRRGSKKGRERKGREQEEREPGKEREEEGRGGGGGGEERKQGGRREGHGVWQFPGRRPTGGKALGTAMFCMLKHLRRSAFCPPHPHPHQDKDLMGCFSSTKGTAPGAFQISHQKLLVGSQSASLSLSGSSNPLRLRKTALSGEKENAGNVPKG